MPNFIQSLYSKFVKSKFSSHPPTLTPFILMGSIGLFMSCKDLFSNPISFLKSSIFEEEAIAILEPQKNAKGTILFDYRNFLSYNKFCLSRFDFINIQRSYCEEFLFYLAHYYEVVCISDGIPLLCNREIKRIDPLNCISYKIFVKDKKEFQTINLNRSLKRLIIISTNENEYNECFIDNILKLPLYIGKNDSNLLDLVHFFTNLHFSKVDDVRDVLFSYRNCNFFDSFKRIQERLFNQRNLFSFGKFETKLKEVNHKKISEYHQIRGKFMKPENLNVFKDFTLRFVKCIFL